MTELADPAAGRATPRWTRAAVALAAGALTGGFAAWAYYDDLFRPLAHSFGLWIALLALLCAGQRPGRAVPLGCAALAAAVVVFYVGKKVVYGIDYPGMPYSINLSELLEWLVLAGVAGVLLGWAFSWAGRAGLAGGVGTAAVLGLLLADAYRRSSGFQTDAPVVVTFAVLASTVVVGATIRSWRQLAVVAGCLLPCAVVGWVLVSAPDLLEQVVITGSF